MPTDRELYINWKIDYSHLSLSEAAHMLSDIYTLSYDSVRSRLSRAGRVAANHVAVYNAQREIVGDIPPSVQHQKRLIADSLQEWQEWQYNEDRIGIFISDAHMPYMRLDAFNLTLNICDSLKPHAITAKNDSLDNKGFGLHVEDDAVYKQVWRQDFNNAVSMQSNYHKALGSTLAPNGKLLELQGNHDAWVYKHWRNHTPQSAEMNIANYMQSIYNDGVLLFSRGEQNTIHLSSGLVWVHGLTVAKLPTTVARKGFEQYMNKGVAKSWVQGHTHRPMYITGDSLGYRGIAFANSGHLRNNDPEWLTHKAVNWGMGIVICQYNPTSWEHDITLVEYREQRENLVAKYDGKNYSVPLQKDRPSYML